MRRSNVNGEPCGFCGMTVVQYRCPGCGCLFPVERNFSFAPAFDSQVSEAKKDADTVDLCLDEDDSQAWELLAVEPGWFLGQRNYDPAPSGSDMYDPGRRQDPPPVPPASQVEATPADFYDARNGCGRWRTLLSGGPHRVLNLDQALALLRHAGFQIPEEVLKGEREDAYYGHDGYYAWAREGAPKQEQESV
jgi:hypothetical protein